MKSKQPPSDRILWSITSLNGKAEWTELCIRTKLGAVLCELAKEGKISVVPRERQVQNQAVILLKSG
jgi:hypothetical protein